MNYKVVADTTKVRIFKQITTTIINFSNWNMLLLIPQRYEFSSKSQLTVWLSITLLRCCWYHKGTNFQANHNFAKEIPHTVSLLLIPQRYEFSSKSQHVCKDSIFLEVVADTTKVRIFKQITTLRGLRFICDRLLLIPQRYEFSSKSQLFKNNPPIKASCCWYHKGTNFQANHNSAKGEEVAVHVVADTTKVRIFKQITTEIILSYCRP